MDTITAHPAPSPQKPSLLINRDFALLWSGQTISIVGDFVFTTTLVLWVALLTRGQSWSPLAVSGVLLAAGVPIVLLGPLAGVFVDRWDKRRTMLGTDALRAVVVAALIPLSGAASLPWLPGGQVPFAWKLGLVYGVVFLVNAADRFFLPAMMGLIGDLVPSEHQPRALGLRQVSASLALVLGPPIAAPLFIVFGPQWALLINALSFVISYATVRAIRAPQPTISAAPDERAHFGREFSAGLRFFFTNRTLVTLLIAALIVMLAGGALNSLDYFFVTGNLHAAVSLYGLVDGVQGLGAIAGSILAALVAQRLGLTRVVWGTLFALGALVLVYSRLTTLAPALVVIGLIGIAASALNVAVSPLVLRVTPRELIGRVSALLDPLVSVAALVGTAIAGYLDGVVLAGFHARALGFSFGPVDSIFFGGGVIALLGAVFAFVTLREPPPLSAVQPVAAAVEPLAQAGQVERYTTP